MSDIDTTYFHIKHRGRPSAPMLEPLSIWQQVWFDLRKRPFHTLAVVPVDEAGTSLYVANALHEVGRVFEGHGLAVVDATRLTLGAARELLITLDPGPGGGSRLVAVDSPLYRPAAMPLATAADAALLVVTLGQTPVPEARKVVELVGRHRFLGTVAVPRRFASEVRP